jgi:translation initiation factor 6
MSLLRTNFDGDTNIGLHGFATDKYCFVGNERYASKIKDTLKVKAYAHPLLDMDLVKILCTGNSSGVVVPGIIRDFDEDGLGKVRKRIEVLTLDTKYTGVGNLMLINDKGIILSPLLRNQKKKVEQFFGLKSEITTIAGMNIIGSLGFATNKGCLVHPKIREREKKMIEKALQVDADICTVNFGSPYPGSGIIANSHGYIVSQQSSGPELGRITDVLGFL